MSFTDGKPRIATEADTKTRWNGSKPGERFRCYLCGHRFVVGDTWRFVYDNDGNGSGHGNFLVCEPCDGPGVRERWKAHARDAEQRFWWMSHDCDC